ncbi:MAG: alpha/beta hydrolase [Clostridia bacterium]|nr:alpha/beta hydrolase [Clostridia bacterium]
MKKIISVFLSVIIVLSVPLCAFAQSEQVPFLLVTGMNVLPLYKDYGTDSEIKAWPMPAGAYAEMGKELILPAARYAADKDKEAFTKSVLESLNGLLEYMKCDDNGDSLYNVSTPQFLLSMANYPDVYENEMKDEQGILNAACMYYGAANVYFYNYDWRLDPLDHADGLNELIKSIKEQKNCSKVNIACCSMGGTVVTSYLYKYGSDNIKNLMFLSTAYQGVEAVADMYTGDLYIDKQALFRRVYNLAKGDLTEFVYQAVLYALDKAGVADALLNYANNLLDNIHDELYDVVLKEIFGNMPAILDLVPASRYEEAKGYMLDENINSKLIERCDEYIYNVQTQSKKLLDSAKANGVNVYIVCQYNMQSLPVSHNCDLNNDLLIDVVYASGGAVCADLEKTLPDGYVQAVNEGHNHISADNVIDASTCMYPDNTWFIKDQAHVDYNVGETTDFIFWLADSDEQLTVFDDERYTQFMIFDYDSNSLEPIDENYKEKTDYFEIVKNVIEFIFDVYRKALSILLGYLINNI